MNMHSRTRFIILITLCLAGELDICRAGADEPKSGDYQDLKTAPFLALQQERDQLADSIRERDGALSIATNYIEWRKLETERRQVLEDAKKNKADTVEIAKRQRDLDEAIASAGHPQTDSELAKSYDKTAAEIGTLRKRKIDIEHEMNGRADVENPKQAFRTNMSVAFTILVGLVIVGFYFLAYLDEGLRREMFSRQSGIQFITLFSLVIAIILFGITGILESRELSALLGGLSGYILGRSTGGSVRQKEPVRGQV
jgi:hypothetical protein